MAKTQYKGPNKAVVESGPVTKSGTTPADTEKVEETARSEKKKEKK